MNRQEITATTKALEIIQTLSLGCERAQAQGRSEWDALGGTFVRMGVEIFEEHSTPLFDLIQDQTGVYNVSMGPVMRGTPYLELQHSSDSDPVLLPLTKEIVMFDNIAELGHVHELLSPSVAADLQPALLGSKPALGLVK